MKSNENQEIEKMFESLLNIIEQKKRIEQEDIPSRLIYEIYCMWTTTKSKILHESAICIEPNIAERLIEKGLVQKISSEVDERFALTLTGIAFCIKNTYGKNLDEQFIDFLALADQKFNTVEKSNFDWKEKLAALSFILLGSSSPSSAIRLSNETNRRILEEFFQKTLAILKKYNIVDKKEELRKYAREESVASAHMSRLNKLGRKTNHYYRIIGKGSEYYLDIEKNGKLDEQRLFFFLRKIFDRFDPGCKYELMQKELQGVSQEYYPRFLARSLNPLIILEISKNFARFLQFNIMKMPLKH
jgi:hypothetical protein